MTTNVSISPERLITLDIAALAQADVIRRAEGDTAPGSVPLFMVTRSSERLRASHRDLSDARFATAVERATRALLSHAAQSAAVDGAETGRFVCPSDLFADTNAVHLLLSRDRTHGVVCAIVGHPADLHLDGDHLDPLG